MKSLSVSVKALALGAAVVGFAYGAQAKTWYVTPDAEDGGEGTSWDAPISLAGAISGATGGTATTDGDEILLKAGDYTLTAAISTSKALTIRGGYAGDGTTRAAGVYSTLDGNKTANAFVFTATAGTATVERVCFRRTSNCALSQTGAATFVVDDCIFEDNAYSTGNITGGCLYMKNAKPVIRNSVFRGNRIRGSNSQNVYGFCIYLYGGSRAYIDDCAFVTNGVALTTAETGYNFEKQRGVALGIENSTATVRNCRFVGSRAGAHNTHSGRVISIYNGTGTSVFTNCVIAANTTCRASNDNWGGLSGTCLIDVEGSSTAQTAEFANCTFAYNLVCGYSCCGVIRAIKGKVKLRNSLFYGNVADEGVARGTDLAVEADGTADVDGCWFSSAAVDNISGANITYGGGNVFGGGDPGFVTPFATMTNCMNATVVCPTRCGAKTIYYKRNAETDAALAAVDVHLGASSFLKGCGIGAFENPEGAAAVVLPGAAAGEGTVVYVKADATGDGGGSSWANAAKTIGAAMDIFNRNAWKTEIWVAGETAFAGETVSPVRDLTVRGGFTGTETTADARAAGAMTALNGDGKTSGLAVFNDAGITVRLESFRFRRGVLHGLCKWGSGDLVLANSAMSENAPSNPSAKSVINTHGWAANVKGSTAATTVTMTNCTVEANFTRNGGNYIYAPGVYAASLKSLVLEDCAFLTNGVSAADFDKGYGKEGNEAAALWANSAPVTARRTRFVGNRCVVHAGSDSGSIVYLDGNCGGSTFENCLWTANSGRKNSNETGSRAITAGLLVINQSSATAAVAVTNCTFAYNVISSFASGAGITLLKGALTLRNSIFYGNLALAGYSYGADLHVASGSTADVDWCWFASDTSDTITGPVTRGDNILTADDFADPGLVSSFDVMPINGGTRLGTTRVTPSLSTSPMVAIAKTADPMAFDCHLKSSKGRYVGGVLVQDETSSQLIDKGDPSSPYAREPEPNGGCVNLGAYGNTAEAAMTSAGKPELSTVTVDQDRDYTQPYFGFTLDGEEDYSATVTLRYGTTDCRTGGTWDHELVLSSAALRGTVFDAGTLMYFDKGTELFWQITVSNSGGSASADGAVTLTNDPPPWYGKGGGANVIHVRPAATCRKDGSSWSDAYTTLAAALNAATKDATKTEIWFAGTETMSSIFAADALTTPLTVRGGFAGTETSAEARPAGAMSTIDGNKAFNGPSVNNGSAAPLAFERFVFTGGYQTGFRKQGGGNISFTDCRFENNQYANIGTDLAFGGHFTGSAGTTEIALTNCIVQGNWWRGGGYQWQFPCYGLAFTNFKRVTLEGCSFVTNGLPPANYVGLPGKEGDHDCAISANAAPVTARNCRFVGNRITTHCNGHGGSIVRLRGAAGTNEFVNCLWIGNSGSKDSGETNNACPRTGCLVLEGGSAEDFVNVENCTFAYNLFPSFTAGSAGLTLIKGAARVRNSIFYGNIACPGYAYGADVNVSASASADIDYTLFSEDSDNCVKGEAVTKRGHCVYGDPLLVTPLSVATNMIVGGTSPNAMTEAGFRLTNASRAAVTYYTYAQNADFSLLNAHLRTRCGYTDETTGEVVRFRRRDCPVNSPAIDAGDPESDFSREAQPNGHRVNLGFYGNTPWSSMSTGGLMIFVR